MSLPAPVRWPLLLALATACGARTGLRDIDAGPRPPECVTDDDCSDGSFCTGIETCHEGRCVPGAPLVCMDADACTDDFCDEDTHACRSVPLSRDADGDGHRGPREGWRPGTPGACGDDCDDANRAVFPGAREVCNGVDDDCNGVVDDHATILPAGPEVRVSEPATAPSAPGGLAWAGEHYLTTHWGYADSKAHVYYTGLDRMGTRVGVPPQRRLTLEPADAFGAGVAWTGHLAGIVWQDRRDPAGGYEIYFNRLSPDGEKLGPDLRVSYAPGFSINPSIAWTGTEFVLAWQDERDTPHTGGYEIYAQRIDVEGRLIEPNQRITREPENSEAPSIATGDAGLGLAWLDGRGGGRAIYFVPLTRELARLAPDQLVSPRGQDAVSPFLTWNRDRWTIAWHDDADGSPDHEVWGATRDAGGLEVTAPRRLTADPGYSRYPTLLPLGDRVLLTWADDRHDGQYEIFTRMLQADLAPLTEETRVTNAPGASVYPVTARGPDGDVGVLFRDQREGRIQVYFTRLRCAL